jgi:hypothetical protein
VLNIKSFISLALLIPSMLAVTALEANANNGKGNAKKADTPVVPAPVITPPPPAPVVNSTPPAPANNSQANNSQANNNAKNDNKKSDPPAPVPPIEVVAPVINLSPPPVMETSNNKNSDKKPDKPVIDLVSPVVLDSSPTVVAPSSTCQAGSVTAGLLSFTSCISGTGNDVQSGKPGEILTSQLATGVFGGIKNWSLLSKVDAGETSSAFNWSGGNKGNWSVTTPLNRPFVLSLKAGTAWSAYYFANASAITQGTWDTLGVVGQKAGQGLSHASIFVAPDDNPPKPVEVPEPTGLVALGIVGALGVKGMKKKALKPQS